MIRSATRYLLLLCLALPGSLNAQDVVWTKKDQQKLDRAGQLEKDGYFNEAIEVYQEVLAHNKDNRELKLAIAGICLKLHNAEEAGRWYADALDKSAAQEVTFDPLHLYNYAELLLSGGQPQEALYWYRAYQLSRPDDTRSARKIDGINRMAQWKEQSGRYKIQELSLNSPYADFSPAFYNDGLVFVSGREEKKKGRGETGEGAEYLDLYYSRAAGDDFGAPEKLSTVINSLLHEGPAVFYDGHRKMIFTRNNADDKTKSSEKRVVIHLQLFYTEKDSATAEWKKPALLSINHRDYSIAHPAISRDGTRLYVSSDMPGGYGGTDLYVSQWTNGAWSDLSNLGSAINTEGNEMFPFLQGDTTLYFASDGHPGMGGLDIYRVNMEKGRVENAGYPVNSPADDFGLIMNEAGDRGYFSSDRNKSRTGQHGDIYQVDIHTPPPPEVDEYLAFEPPDTLIEIYYTVQILALKNPKTIGMWFVKDLQGVLKHDGKDGLHRYTYGTYKTLDEAVVELERIRAKGYLDAFVRKEERYRELSKRPGVAIEVLNGGGRR